MQKWIALGIMLTLVATVLLRSHLLKQRGIKAMKFGETDRNDFLILPFAAFYFFMILASVLNLPRPGTELFRSEAAQWAGVILNSAGLAFFLYSLISFGKSFRVGIDETAPGDLVTTGAYAISRNPMYTAFGIILAGNFLVFTNWIFLVYWFAGLWLFNRQVMREEESLRKLYGKDYIEYCSKVPRYF